MPFKKIIILTTLCLLTIALFTYWANTSIINQSKPFVTYDITKLPTTKVGLLLGTTKTLKNGTDNEFFFNRIDATVALFKSGKIKYVIVSGDNGNKNYNEPEDMQLELIKKGIPDSAIYLDFAGFRTLDSVVRALKIFGQKKIIIISQQFHNERAVFIGRKFGIDAYGYNAKEVRASFGFKTKVREVFARNKVYIDLLLNTSPKFLGDSIAIK